MRMSIFGTSEPKFLLNEPDRKETLVLSPAAGLRLLSVRPESSLSSSVHLFNLKTLSVPAACGSPPPLTRYLNVSEDMKEQHFLTASNPNRTAAEQ